MKNLQNVSQDKEINLKLENKNKNIASPEKIARYMK